MTNKNVNGQSAEVVDNDTEEVNNKNSDDSHKDTAYTAHKTQSEKHTRWFSPMLITILLALPLAAVIAYIYMPDELSQYFVSENNTETAGISDSANKPTNTDYIPTAGGLNTQPGSNTQNVPASVATTSATNSQPHASPSDWAAQQRADFERGRAEFLKRNADGYAKQWPSAEAPEPPQWVKDRQQQMQQQYAAMQKQREQYMKQMQEQQARWGNYQNPHQPTLSQDQQDLAVNRQPQQSMMPYTQGYPVNPYNQQPRNYQPAPAYYYGPYARPYAYPGYR